MALGALTGPAVAHASAGPGAPLTAMASDAADPAFGDFTAQVDFLTLERQNAPGNRCELTVSGTLTFTGTLTGEAEGTTTAVIFAPCSEALPPGTSVDVFHFEGVFTGSVAGTAVTGPLSYAGVTRRGGAIDATIFLSDDEASAVLEADAQVATGGSYTGIVKVG